MKNNSYTFITGASSGIGKSLATECAKRRMNLVLIALPQTGLPAVAHAFQLRYDIEVIALEGDLTEISFIYSLANHLTTNNISLSILINNAGIGYEGKFDELTVDFCNKLMLLNMQATVLLSRLLIENLKKCESSFILNVSSMASFTPMPYKCMYAASKSFVFSFSRALRNELNESTISVSVLCPGAVPTNEMTKKLIASHGFYAKFFTVDADELAIIAIRETLRKKAVIVPGFGNKLSMYFMKIIPQSIQLSVLANRYAKLNTSIS